MASTIPWSQRGDVSHLLTFDQSLFLSLQVWPTQSPFLPTHISHCYLDLLLRKTNRYSVEKTYIPTVYGTMNKSHLSEWRVSQFKKLFVLCSIVNDESLKSQLSTTNTRRHMRNTAQVKIPGGCVTVSSSPAATTLGICPIIPSFKWVIVLKRVSKTYSSSRSCKDYNLILGLCCIYQYFNLKVRHALFYFLKTKRSSTK